MRRCDRLSVGVYWTIWRSSGIHNSHANITTRVKQASKQAISPRPCASTALLQRLDRNRIRLSKTEQATTPTTPTTPLEPSYPCDITTDSLLLHQGCILDSSHQHLARAPSAPGLASCKLHSAHATEKSRTRHAHSSKSAKMAHSREKGGRVVFIGNIPYGQ